MTVSLDEQRFSRVHGDGEPDFIELPARQSPRSLPTRHVVAPPPAPRKLNQDRERGRVPSSSGVTIHVDPRHDDGYRRYGSPDQRWRRMLSALFTFEQNTGYAISVTVHVILIIILSLFLLGGSEPTPRVVIESTITEEVASVGDFVEAKLTPSRVPLVTVPVVGDMESQSGDGLGRLFGDDGAQFFGLRDGGRDFVYIVDCSGSMEGPPFARARLELLNSINELESDQRLYVMFFSSSPYLMFNESGPPAGLVPATADNKQRIRNWVERIDAGGGTKPEQALKWALGLDPDAVFLLSDGKFDDIVDGISDANGGRSRIHTISFMNQAGEELLRRMADENGGTYRFVP